jgi:hypothetical protein
LGAKVAFLNALALQEIPGITGRTSPETAQLTLPLWNHLDFVCVSEGLAIICGRVGNVAVGRLILEFPHFRRAVGARGKPGQERKNQQTGKKAYKLEHGFLLG